MFCLFPCNIPGLSSTVNQGGHSVDVAQQPNSPNFPPSLKSPRCIQVYVDYGIHFSPLIQVKNFYLFE